MQPSCHKHHADSRRNRKLDRPRALLHIVRQRERSFPHGKNEVETWLLRENVTWIFLYLVRLSYVIQKVVGSPFQTKSIGGIRTYTWSNGSLLTRHTTEINFVRCCYALSLLRILTIVMINLRTRAHYSSRTYSPQLEQFRLFREQLQAAGKLRF